MHCHSSTIVTLSAAVLLGCGTASSTRATEPAEPRYEQAQAVAGASKLVPGQWGLLRMVVVNPTDRPIELLSSAYFDRQSHVQYAREIWVPARARRAAWHPVLPPPGISRKRTHVDVISLLIDRTNKPERVISAPSGGVLHKGSLNVHHERPVTGLISDDDAEARLLVDVARQSQNRIAPVLLLPGEPMPPSWETLQGFDQLVICTDRVLDDAAGMIAIRRWLQDGGRLWIMLDRVAPATPAVLLGDDYRCQVVDRTSLVDWQVKDERHVAKREDGPRQQSAEPVDLVRVLADDLAPAYTVDGWPAAFWQRVGRGEVLYTTLDVGGWTRSRTSNDPPPIDALRPLPCIATGPLAALAADFLRQRSLPTPSTDVWNAYVQEEVGHRIIGRSSVAALLGGLSLSLLVCGVWLAQRERLAHLGWMGPLLAAVASIALVGLGHRGRQAAPDTVALAQFVEVESESTDFRVRGLMGVYAREPSAGPFAATRGGIFAFDSIAGEAQAHRMVWTDLEEWHWENLELPAGLSMAPFSYSASLDKPPIVTATFDELGLLGKISAGPFQELRDAILLGPSGLNMTALLDADGSFRAGTGSVLTEGQYAAHGVLDDLQRRRQSVLRGIVPQLGRQAAPRLLAWTSSIDPGFVVADDARTVGAALVSLPLMLTKPARGSRITVPAPLITHEAIKGPDGTPVSPAYSNADGRWVGPLVRSTKTTIRFQLPREVAPLRMERATLSLRIHAPARMIEVAGWRGNDPITLAKKHSPVGMARFGINPADGLLIDSQGVLVLNINVGAHPREETANAAVAGWKIEQMSLEVTGVTGDM